MSTKEGIFTTEVNYKKIKQTPVLPVHNFETRLLAKQLNNQIKNNVTKMSVLGIVMITICIASTGAIFLDIKYSIDNHLQIFGNNILKQTKYPTQAVAVLIFRYTSLAAIASTIMIASLRMAIACFDQSVRFTKRQLSNNFLDLLYRIHLPQMTGKITLPQLMDAVEMWTKNVESAFSKVTTEKQEVKNAPKQKLKTNAKK